MTATETYEQQAKAKILQWKEDWCLFAKEAMGVILDPEQEAILRSVQFNKMTSVASGTARGKDFIAAVAAICFLYLTPVWNKQGELIENTKVALTAPTDRQVANIMVPEFSRLIQRARARGVDLPGRLTAYDIRTDNKEWFLTGFKADDTNTEAWSGFHAANTMFVVTEASGMSETVFNAIEGNLQGNSRILIVFNPNVPTGYAAASQKSPRWKRFRLDSLSAPNVLEKKMLIPGQVDYEWVADKVQAWCQRIAVEEMSEGEGDFLWEGFAYRPNDLFRVKVRGLFPKVSSDVLIPAEWIELANNRWKEAQTGNIMDPQGNKGSPAHLSRVTKPLRLGVDVAGMGRDNSCFVFRHGNYVDKIELFQSKEATVHMEVAGKVAAMLRLNTNTYNAVIPQAFIDTIGEGAGVYSRLAEQQIKTAHSCKFSEGAEDSGGNPYKDITEQYEFLNMRAYSYWAIRDWLDPARRTGAMLPVDDELLQELTETKWKFMSNGKIQIEAKEDIKKRLKRSPDKADALANTFWPIKDIDPRPKVKQNAWMGGLK